MLLRARAIENQVYVFAPAQCGHHGGQRRSYGHALVVDPWGVVSPSAATTRASRSRRSTSTTRTRCARPALPRAPQSESGHEAACPTVTSSDADDSFDLVVIGSGPAGEKGAAQAAYFGKKVALVEKAPALGGASVHTGTLPSKTLRETALYLTGFQRRRLTA